MWIIFFLSLPNVIPEINKIVKNSRNSKKFKLSSYELLIWFCVLLYDIPLFQCCINYYTWINFVRILPSGLYCKSSLVLPKVL